MKTKQSLVTFLVFTLTTFVSAAHAQNTDQNFDIILSIPELKVEDLELFSYSLGAENNIDIGRISGGGGAGKATFKEFSITKSSDAVTTKFFEKLVKGDFFSSLKLKDRNMEFEFRLVFVEDYAASRSDGDDVIEETWVFQFGEVNVKQFEFDKSGKASITNEYCWSVVFNRDC